MSLFAELKRRNVIRVTAAYVVVGWLLIQVLELAADSFEAPAWVMKMIITVLVIGFIPTVLFSWAFELTPDGIKKDGDVAHSRVSAAQTSNKLNVITIIAVIGAAGIAGWQQLGPSRAGNTGSTTAAPETAVGHAAVPAAAAASPVDPVSDASIAVLPFADLSPGGDQEYFSDGISEEILNVLVRIESLKVASRTSAFGFKGQESLGIPVIAERLRVRHVLEGSVRKSGDMVRITAQLIDAQSDTHLWSETFDKTLTTGNIFAIQDEIAKAIVEQLGLVLNPNATGASIASSTTENLDAYDLYLQANDIYRRRSGTNIPEMTALYEQAVALDPDFALAWAGLASAYLIHEGWDLGSREEYHPKTRQAADRATAIDEDLALPYAIRGGLALDNGDMFAAIEQTDKAVERDALNPDIFYRRGEIWLSLGHFERAENDYRRCLQLDPGLEICRRFLSFALLFNGKEEEGQKLYETGVLRGQLSYLGSFDEYYAATGNESALANSIAMQSPTQVWWREPSFKLLTRPDYSLENFEEDVQAGVVSATGERLPAGAFNRENLLTEFFPPMLYWNKYKLLRLRPELYPEFEQTRKQKMIDYGLVEYWKANGYPPQCRQLADDDFVCD